MMDDTTKKIVFLSLSGLSAYLAYRKLRSAIIADKIREGMSELPEALSEVGSDIKETIGELFPVFGK